MNVASKMYLKPWYKMVKNQGLIWKAKEEENSETTTFSKQKQKPHVMPTQDPDHKVETPLRQTRQPFTTAREKTW
jgi:hypothetical protein